MRGGTFVLAHPKELRPHVSQPGWSSTRSSGGPRHVTPLKGPCELLSEPRKRVYGGERTGHVRCVQQGEDLLVVSCPLPPNLDAGHSRLRM